MASVDYNIRNELSDVIEDLTTTGEPSLDPALIKKVKNICKKSDDYVRHAYHMVFSQLRKQHAQIRLSCVLIMNELFMRSHLLRELLLNDFQKFLELTVETNPQDEPLPSPESVAQSLKTKTLEVVHKWHEKFGSFYKKLDLGYNFLKRSKKVDFNNMNVRSTAERQLAEEREIRRQNAWMEKFKKVENEIKEMENEMKLCVTEMENCFQLLLPRPDSFENLFSADMFEETHLERKSKKNSTVASDKEKRDNGLVTVDDFNTACVENLERTCLGNYELKSRHIKDNGSSIDCIVASECTGKPQSSTDLCNDNKGNSTMEHCEEKEEVKVIKFRKTDQTCSDMVMSEDECDDQTCNHGDTGKRILGCDDIETELKKLEKDKESESNEDEFETDNTTKCISGYDQRSKLIANHGLALSSYKLDITLNIDKPSIQENEDNRDIIDNLREMHQQVIQKYIPMVSNWLKILSKGHSEQKLIKNIINLKMSLETTRDKCTDLKIDMSPRKRTHIANLINNKQCDDDDDDDGDDEFEDVPEKEGFEEHVPAHLRVEYGLEPLRKDPSKYQNPLKRTCPDWIPPVLEVSGTDELNDPASFATAVKKIQEKVEQVQKINKNPTANCHATSADPQGDLCQASTTKKNPTQPTSNTKESGIERNERKRLLLEKAPVVPFGLDLQYWEKPMETPLVVKYTSLEKFWLPKEYENEEFVPDETKSALKTRTIKFTGEFQPIKWTCRAPLPSGKLCPRRDRFKCPLHGPVIARNEDGSPANAPETKEECGVPDDVSKDDSKEEEDWRAIQHDVEAALGFNLGGRRKKRKNTKQESNKSSKTKSRYARLTNLKKITDNSRARLENKVMNKASLKRVAEEMDVIATKRFKDKFGNNFNYSLNP